MQKMFNKLRRVLCLLLIAVIALTAGTWASPEISAVVITFGPPVENGQNLLPKLLEQIKNAIGSSSSADSFAAEVEKDGATWQLSRNFSGIQFALLYPEKSERLTRLTEKFLRQLTIELQKTPPHIPEPAFIEKLAACLPGLYHLPGYENVSLETHGISLDEFNRLKELLDPVKAIYAPPSTECNSLYPVLPGTEPTLVKMLTWKETSSASFFSAKFTGERFCRDIPGSPRYEIMFHPGCIRLFLYYSAEENELFQIFPRFSEFVQKIESFAQTPDWQTYAGNAAQIVVEDRRDLKKNLLQKAWIKHWNSLMTSDEIRFNLPQSQENLICMPEKTRHFFSRSRNTFPRIAAARTDDDKQVADVAIHFTAEKKIIDEIVKTLDNDQTLSIPLSISCESEQVLSIQFHSQVELIPRAISGIRSRILNHLALKQMVNDLPSELLVSIAATGNMPPFLLKGLMQQGWPADPAAYSWRMAGIEDMSEILGVEDDASFARRLALRTVNGRARVKLLAELISRGLFIDSFDFKR